MESDSRSGEQGKGALEELMRERIRATIESLVDEELKGALGAARSQRVGPVRTGYRHGKRARTLTTSLGATTTAMPRARIEVELTRFRGVCLAGKARRRAMPKTHPPYPAEYRRRMVEQVRAGRSLKELAREFEPSVESIRQWVRQAQLDLGERSDGLTSSEREELTRLRRENRVLREEREILSKAAAWFATETGSVPSRRSNS